MTDKMREAYDALFRLNDLMGEHLPDSVKNDDSARKDMDFLVSVIEQAAQRQGGEAVAYCFVDVDGNPSELCHPPECASPEDSRTIVPLYTAPQPAVPEGWAAIEKRTDFENAPKDGTQILTFCELFGFQIARYGDYPDWNNDSEDRVTGWSDGIYPVIWDGKDPDWWAYLPSQPQPQPQPDWIACSACKGTGYQSAGGDVIGTWPCSLCNGKGKRPEPPEDAT